MMTKHELKSLDDHITGHYGEDQFAHLKTAYRCGDKNCQCHDIDNLLRHCPGCNYLYLFDLLDPGAPCIECQTKQVPRFY